MILVLQNACFKKQQTSSGRHIIRWGWFAFFSWSRVRLHSRNMSWEIFLKNDEWKKQQQQQETNQIVSSWTNITAVKMAEIITKRVSFEIEISVWRSPLFSILFVWCFVYIKSCHTRFRKCRKRHKTGLMNRGWI